MKELLKTAIEKGYNPTWLGMSEDGNDLTASILWSFIKPEKVIISELGLLQAFLREKGVDVWAQPEATTSDIYGYTAFLEGKNRVKQQLNTEPDYQTALISGLKKALELI